MLAYLHDFLALSVFVFVIVVVASDAVPVAVSVPVTKLEVVAFSAVRLVKAAVTALRSDEKKLDDVALVVDAFVAKRLVAVADVVTKVFEVRAVAVVVARVEVPAIANVPLALRFPCASAKKLRFSVQALPFQ